MDDVPVRVEVERSGGFAGLVTCRTADTAELPPAAAEELRRIVAGAGLAGLAQRLAEAPPPPAGGSDRFQYDVTVHEGEQVYSFTVHDGSVPAELQPLLTLVDRPPTA